ncbi:cytochrome P450 [Ilyonectria destructans]|nr:cytochrome P450 [Ilyonectria destructans]
MAGNITSESQGFLSFLADDYKQSKAAYLTVLGVLISATLLHKLFSPHNDSREPPLLKPSIPVLGHLIGLLRHQGGYIKILYDTTREQIATLPILNGKLYVIFDSAIIQSAYRNKKLSFEPFAVEFAQRELRFGNEALKIIQETTLVPEFFSVIHPAMTGAHLHRMNATALNYVSNELHAIGSGGEALEVINLYQWVRDLMTLATTEALYGPDNPIKKHSGLVQDLWTFERDLPMLLLNVFPSITARVAHNARANLQTALAEYYGAEKDHHEDAAQIVKTRANVLRSYGFPGTEVGNFELALLHVATANTIPTLFWFMAQIFTRPELVMRLREEVMPAAQHGTDNEVTIDITTLDQKCPLLVSCYREAIRLSNQAVGNRRVLEDTTVSDGKGNSYLLKKGLNVQMSAEVLHSLKDVWGDNVDEFDPERFIEISGKENSQTEKAKRLSFIPFGGGRNLCPGRNFAFAENLGFVTCLLLGFDISPLSQDADFKVPVKMRCSFSEAAGKPINNGEGFGVQIQKKKGWESTKWLFLS